VSDRIAADVPHVLTTWRTPQQRSERVKLRRAVTFLAMTLVLPGSAQMAAGSKRLGRIALRIWAGLWILALLTGLFALAFRGAAIELFTSPVTLRLVQIALIVLGLGWAALLIDAWRISRPPDLARRHRLAFSVLSIGLAVSVLGGLMASATMVSAQRELVSSVFAGGGDEEVKEGRYNILLLGGDAGPNRSGLRPDSMTVASVDAVTGRTVLISLPRNMERVPFPNYSPFGRSGRFVYARANYAF